MTAVDDLAQRQPSAALASGRLRQLSGACHPAPVVAVTAFATTLAIVAGNHWSTCLLVAVAVFCGQLSIGWSNDRIDVERDRRAGRSDKPLARPGADLRTVDRAIVAALAGTMAFSCRWAGRPPSSTSVRWPWPGATTRG